MSKLIIHPTVKVGLEGIWQMVVMIANIGQDPNLTSLIEFKSSHKASPKPRLLKPQVHFYCTLEIINRFLMHKMKD